MSLNIKFVVRPADGCCWHRLVNPLDNLPYKPEDSVALCVQGQNEIFSDCNILMFNREIATSVPKLLHLQRIYGFKIVVDVDDYWILDKHHMLYDSWNENKYGERILEYVSIADLVTTTNIQLREALLQYNKNVLVVPNTLKFDEVPNKQQIDNLRFIYVGGITHVPDVNLLKPKFKRIGEEPFIRDSSHFILCGFDTKNPSNEWLEMQKVFQLTRNYLVFGSLPLDDYMNHYNNGDVALIPLVDSEFNNKKSVLKVLEAGNKGLPCIVSKVQPYYPELKDAPGILWVETPNDWLKHIRYCLKNRDWVKTAGIELYKYLKGKYDMRTWCDARYKILTELTNQN